MECWPALARFIVNRFSWRVVEPILGASAPVIEYEPGTWGPKEADDLISSHGGWVNPEAG